jgi:transposase
MTRHTLTDEQWELVEPLIPRSTAKTGRPANDRRLMLDGVFWILGTGAPWRDLPEHFGPFQSVHRYFSTWQKAGVFTAILQALQIKLDKEGLIDWELWSVDGSIARAARCAAGAEKKVSTSTPTSRLTTRWAAAEADLEPNSIWSVTATARRSPST